MTSQLIYILLIVNSINLSAGEKEDWEELLVVLQELSFGLQVKEVVEEVLSDVGGRKKCQLWQQNFDIPKLFQSRFILSQFGLAENNKWFTIDVRL